MDLSPQPNLKRQNKLTNNKFMTEQICEGHEIPIYSVIGSRKFKDIQARLLFNLCETSITSQMMENVCNVVLLLTAADWFSTAIIESKVACICFLNIVV